MGKNMGSLLKNKKIALLIIVVVIAIVIILIVHSSKNTLVGKWEIANISEWEEYDRNAYNDELPYSLELFSDGMGIRVEKSYSRPDSITWHADNGRLRIDGEVFNYKISFGKLVLNYVDDEKNNTMKYVRN